MPHEQIFFPWYFYYCFQLPLIFSIWNLKNKSIYSFSEVYLGDRVWAKPARYRKLSFALVVNIFKIRSLTTFIQQEVILVTELFRSTCNKNVIIAKEILKAHHLQAKRKGRHCMKYLIIGIVKTINPSLFPSAWKFFTFNGINRASSPDTFQSCALTICYKWETLLWTLQEKRDKAKCPNCHIYCTMHQWGMR